MKVILASIITLCMVFLGGCDRMLTPVGANEIKTVGDIAYNKNKKAGNTIYLLEDGQYVPYLVLTDNYNGNCLLLRKYLLDKPMPFKENESGLWAREDYGAYYPESSIDAFLNTEFYDMLSQAVKDVITDSEIVITDKSSLGVTGDMATTISRKVFLLSYRELNGQELQVAVTEGQPLEYFKDGDFARRVAMYSDGTQSPYWTRTPETWESYTVFTIGINAIGAGAADIYSGVRPAFCVDKATPIISRTDIVDGYETFSIE